MALTATGLELAAGQHPACPCPVPSCTTSLTGSWGPAAWGFRPAVALGRPRSWGCALGASFLHFLPRFQFLTGVCFPFVSGLASFSCLVLS